MDRRTFIRGMCAGGVATFTSPTLSLATVPGSGKLVFVLLRGGLDGLSAVVPYGDRDYQDVRGAMAFKKADLEVLNDHFGLAPGLHPLKQLWDQGELAVVHAMAIPYRTRSHFDGQAILETGLDAPRGSSDGWLNRLLQVMEGKRSGIAVAAGLPLSLSGAHPVKTWSPANLGVVDDGYVDRLHVLYRHDPRLLDRFEAALQMPRSGNDGDLQEWGPPADRVHSGGHRPLFARARWTQPGRRGVQRLGYPRQPGTAGGTAGSTSGPTGQGNPDFQVTSRVQLGSNDHRSHDRVRPDCQAQWNRGDRSRYGRCRIHHRAQSISQ